MMTRVHTYYSSATLITDLKDHKPVAFVEFNDNIFCAKVHTLWFHLKPVVPYCVQKGGHDYLHWEMTGSYFPVSPNDILKRSCILLPLLFDERCIYTAIAEDYTEINKNGVFEKKCIDINELCT